MLSGLLLSALPPDLARAGTDLQYLTFHPVPLTQATRIPAHDSAGSVVDFVLPSSGPDPAARETVYRSAIAAIRNTQGFNALPVSEQALALGQLLQQQGQLDAALEAYETSMHVLRVNLGLYSLEQVPVLKAIINTHVERRDVASAHMMQEALFNLVLRHHGRDNLAAVPALLEWADWNVNLYLLLDPEPGLPLSNSPYSQLYDPRLALAYSTYQVALQSLQEGDERLVTTERKLAALNFIINRKMHDTYGNALAYYPMTPAEAPDDVLDAVATAHFYDGSSALRRALAHSFSRPERRNDDIAARMVELGDWYLLFDRRAAALDLYRDALHFMHEASLPQEEVERIMSPGMPVPTPDTAYLASGVDEYADENEFDGFIDVEFELSKFGMATNPHIIGRSEENRRIERELLLEIRSCKFRPKFVADAPTSEKMQLRYYYSF